MVKEKGGARGVCAGYTDRQMDEQTVTALFSNCLKWKSSDRIHITMHNIQHRSVCVCVLAHVPGSAASIH